jgi:hypothetical protein
MSCLRGTNVRSIKYAGITIGMAMVLTLASSSVSVAQVIVGGGYPYPAYRYYRDASMRFDVKPNDASVYVDGYYAGVVDDFDGAFQRLHTAPGGHEVTLFLEGYRTYTERVYLSPDNTFKLHHAMERLAAGERSERPPAPQPPQQFEGQGGPPPEPGVGAPLPRGPVGGRRLPRNYPPPPPPDSAPQPPPGPATSDNRDNRGTLSLNLQPSDAEVLVDGTPWRGPNQDRLLIDLSEGRHNVQIRKSGFIGYLTDVQIRRGETTSLDVRLKTQP